MTPTNSTGLTASDEELEAYKVLHTARERSITVRLIRLEYELERAQKAIAGLTWTVVCLGLGLVYVFVHTWG